MDLIAHFHYRLLCDPASLGLLLRRTTVENVLTLLGGRALTLLEAVARHSPRFEKENPKYLTSHINVYYSLSMEITSHIA